jgi:hypothetical protein
MMVMVKGTTKEGREERWISLFWMYDAAFVIYFLMPTPSNTKLARRAHVSYLRFFAFDLKDRFATSSTSTS